MKKKSATPERIEKIIRTIAEQNHTTVEDVRAEMAKAMAEGLNNPDPQVQEKWKEIPCEGEVPTPEELIAWAANRLQ